MSLKFAPAGLDIRKHPPGMFPSADATAWDQDEYLYDRAQTEFGLHENFMQLLHSDREGDINKLASTFTLSSVSKLVMLELIESTLATYSPSYPTLPLPSELTWETLGFDVCDINGFFSFLHMNVDECEPMSIFREDQLLDALALSEVANIQVPAHRPFVVVKLKQLLPKD